jgi:1,4-alpha-glucan branching enzyme
MGSALSALWLISGRQKQVEFRLYAPQARSVSIVGNFSAWGSSGLPMSDIDGDGVWTKKTYLKRGIIYTYNFLIDEERLIADPESTLRVPDGFGGESSVLRVE